MELRAFLLFLIRESFFPQNLFQKKLRNAKLYALKVDLVISSVDALEMKRGKSDFNPIYFCCGRKWRLSIEREKDGGSDFVKTFFFLIKTLVVVVVVVVVLLLLLLNSSRNTKRYQKGL